MYTVGIDIGSMATKSAILDDENNIVSYDVVFTGGNNSDSAKLTFNNVLKKGNLTEKDIYKVVTTGYGRENVSFSDHNVSEITCHAKGMHLVNPEIQTILDIGGQDSKVIKIDDFGNIEEFLMNDKCAAGCGRFLDIIARALSVDLADLGEISRKSNSAAKISSMCSVFAETEVVSLVAVGTPIEDIIKGVHYSIANRAIALMETVGIEGAIGMSGGVARNVGVVDALREKLNCNIFVSQVPQIVGALGAAYIGKSL